VPDKESPKMKSVHDLNDAQVSDIVQMALSDHVAFADIEHQYGLKEKEVVALMRNTLRTGSYRAWRKRVATFGRRREHYKWWAWTHPDKLVNFASVVYLGAPLDCRAQLAFGFCG
jgi:uncharacterized protein (TIGR03643 family)